MIPSITFIKDGVRKNTLTDWRLAPTQNPIFAIPQQKVTTIEIPGRDGVLDISNSIKLGGGPLFNNREGTFEFVFLDMTYYDSKITWDGYLQKRGETLNDILSFLHGYRLNAMLDDDWVYRGRFWVESFDDPSDGSSDKITIGYSVEPYKSNGDIKSI